MSAARLLDQASALVGLRWTLWQRRLWREKAVVRLLLQLFGVLGGGALSLSLAFRVYREAARLSESRFEVLAAGGPLAIAAAWLTLGFAARLYLALLSLARGTPFLDPRRFLLYAVPPKLVTAINVVAQLFEPVWLFFYPPAIAVALGVARIPGAPGVFPLLFAIALLVLAAAAAFQLALAAIAEVNAHRVLRRLLFAGILGAAALFFFGVLHLAESAEDLSLEGVSWPLLRRMPPGWAVALADALSRGRPLDALGDLSLLLSAFCFTVALAHRLSLREARRAGETVLAGKPPAGAPGWSLPPLSGPVSALIEKEFKTVFRAGWQQMIAAPVGFLILRFAVMHDGARMVGPQPLLVAAGYAHLGVLGYTVNAFGWEVDAARGWFLWPVRGRTVLAAKNAVAYCVSLLIFSVLAGLSLLGGKLTGEQLVVGLCAHAATFPLLATVGNACSVWFPSPMRGARMRRSPGGTAVLARLSTLGLVALAAWAPYGLAKLLGIPLIAAYLGELLVMAVAYGGLLAASESLLRYRREPMLKLLARDE